MNFLKKLYVQVFIGLFLGILLGHFLPDVAVHFKFLSDVFIRIIKMLIAPIIFLTLVPGIAAMNNMRKVSALAGSALVFFIVITTFALGLGLLVADFYQPGKGLNIDPSSLNIEEAASYLGNSVKIAQFSDLLLHIIPNTFLGALVDGDLLQVIFISLLFAIGLIWLF